METLILQKEFAQTINGKSIFKCVQQRGGVLSHGYVIDAGRRFFRHWASVVRAAKRA